MECTALTESCSYRLELRDFNSVKESSERKYTKTLLMNASQSQASMLLTGDLRISGTDNQIV